MSAKKYRSTEPMQFEGMWISPKGKVYPVVEHLIFVQQNPRLFGLSEMDVQAASIDDLRNLAVQVIEDGWIRARYLAPQGYLFEMNEVSQHHLSIIEELLVSAQALTWESITIEVIRPRPKTYQGTMQEFLERSMFAHYINPPKKAGRWRLS